MKDRVFFARNARAHTIPCRSHLHPMAISSDTRLMSAAVWHISPKNVAVLAPSIQDEVKQTPSARDGGPRSLSHDRHWALLKATIRSQGTRCVRCDPRPEAPSSSPLGPAPARPSPDSLSLIVEVKQVFHQSRGEEGSDTFHPAP